MTTETSEHGGSNGERASVATVRRVLAVLGVVVLIAAVVPFVLFAVPQVVGADHGFVILSGSMEPELSPGDVVIVDESASVGVGDVITFDDGNEVPTTHRVVGVEDGQFVTKGDANENADGNSVSPGAVLGRVTLTIPLIGHVILWANTPVGYISLVLVPIGLLLLNELYAWARGGDADGTEDERPGPTPAIRRIEDARAVETAPADAPSDPPSGTGTVPALDVKLTALATAVLFGYACWNVYGDVSAGTAPDPVSIAAATAGLSGLAFVTWLMGGTWLSARRDPQSTAPDSTPESADESPVTGGDGPTTAHTDGGTTEEVDP